MAIPLRYVFPPYGSDMDKQINPQAAVIDALSTWIHNKRGSAFATTLRRALVAVSTSVIAVLGVMVPAAG